MKFLKTTWADVRSGRAGVRQYVITERRTVDQGRGGLHRTYDTITCPFCHHPLVALTRSLCAVGKRCQSCGALHDGVGSAYRLKETPKA